MKVWHHLVWLAVFTVVSTYGEPAFAQGARVEKPQLRTLVGRVVDSMLQPIEPTATVELRHNLDDAKPAFTTQTDALGTFFFPRVPRKRWWVVVGKPGYHTAILWTYMPESFSALKRPVVLYDAVTVKGTVLNEDGEPQANARVLVVFSRSKAVGHHPVEVTTDEKGYYEVNNAPLGYLDIMVDVAGYVPKVVRQVLHESTTVDFNLTQEDRTGGVTINWHIKGFDGARAATLPYWGLQYFLEGSYHRLPLPKRLAYGVLSADGRARVNKLPPGRYKIMVAGDSVLIEPDQIELDEALQDGDEYTANFTFSHYVRPKKETDEQFTITGSLVASTGKPLPGETLVLKGASFRPEIRAITDAAGRFAVDSPVPVGDSFHVWLESETLTLVGGRPHVLRIAEKGGHVALEAKIARTISGVVYDVSGQPMAGAVVSYRGVPGHADNSKHGYGHTFTDHEGKFKIGKLQAQDEPMRVEVKDIRGRGWVDVLLQEPGDQNRKIVVNTEEAGSISGIVEDGNGEPLAGVRVDCAYERPERRGHFVMTSTISNRHGKYVFGALSPGYYKINASFKESHGEEYQESRLELEKGQRVELDLVPSRKLR